MENCSQVVDNCTDFYEQVGNETVVDSGPHSCGEWEPAQHNLFQISNLFFAAAFLIPKSYKQGIIFLRALLSIGFAVQAVWSGVNVCSEDIVIWSVVLATVNLGHMVALTARLVPPSLTPELTELYVRLFHPLKVSRKHFKELVREGSIHLLDAGQAYAVEDQTNADEKLSVLLKGKLKVTCDNIHLHHIAAFQFIDSPEWEAGHITSDELFQVTITAEEDSMYFCWPKLKLDRVLRHRPMLKVVLSNLIGKDITQKLYWLNEAMGMSGGLPTSRDTGALSRDEWRALMPRSRSVDAVSTAPGGQVRSATFTRPGPQRRDSAVFTHNMSPTRSLNNRSRSPLIGSSVTERIPLVGPPVVATPAVPAVPAPNLPPIGQPLAPIYPSTPARTSSVRRQRAVKFDESNV